jgi:hypothetical protein
MTVTAKDGKHIININIENNLLSKNKDLSEENIEGQKIKPRSIMQNLKYPSIVNEYYGVQAKKRLYDFTRFHKDVSVPSLNINPSFNPTFNPTFSPNLNTASNTQPNTEPNTQPQGDIQEDEEFDEELDNENDFADATDPQTAITIYRMKTSKFVPKWETISEKNLYQFVDLNGRKPKNSPEDWKERVQAAIAMQTSFSSI